MKKKILAIILVLVLAVSSLAIFASCVNNDATGGTLVVGYSEFSSKFSTFFAKTAYDQDVATMTGIGLLTNTRGGNMVLKGIEGQEETYNGTNYHYTGPADVTIDTKATETVYSIKIREDLKFSDGTPVTIDDVIFSMYVISDPSYTGSSTLYSQPIKGMTEYRTGVSSNIAAKYAAMADLLYAAGAGNTDFTKWTEEQQNSYYGKALDTAGAKFAQEIVDYVISNYISYADEGEAGDYTSSDVIKTDGLQIAFGMGMWGFGSFAGKTFTDALGNVYDTEAGEYPTIEDYWTNIYENYEGDLAEMEVETAGSALGDLIKDEFIRIEGPKDPDAGGEIVSIEGIKKTGKYSMTVTTAGFDATTIYQLGVTIAPMHYYGDTAKYDYDNNKFGFDKGDLSTVEAKTTSPMGAGPYKFIEFVNGIVYFEANPYYYKGAPKITYLRFRETRDPLKTQGLIAGTFDITDPSISDTTVEEIKDANSNGELTGDTIETSLIDNLGYGYIGINSVTVNVGGQQGSTASKNYRKGLATLLAVFRDVVVNSYYGDQAVVIQYPISNTSWAAPSPADTGYRTAYSLDIDGQQIYTTSMLQEQKYDAAITAAIGFLKAAGFTYSDSTGKFTAAPAGATLSLTLDIPAAGTGDHPSFAIFTYFASEMEKLGFTVEVNDHANANATFWPKLEAGQMQIWAAAWQATIDPDMYQVYHSSNGIGLGGTDSNHYNISDTDLDAKIIEARTSADNAYRKTIYKEALDIVMDWAVEVPVYQRKNCVILSPNRIKMNTMTPDITTFWGWSSEIEKLEMYPQN